MCGGRVASSDESLRRRTAPSPAIAVTWLPPALARLVHTVAYGLGFSPLRSIAFGIAAQSMLVMAGRCAAWLLPSAQLGVQIMINSPMLLQWLVGLGALASVREQRQRYDEVAALQGARELRGTVSDSDEEDS